MKSTMPYLGVRMPRLRHAWCVVLESNPLASQRDLHRALRELWDGAEYREER
jgi:DnaJ-domain-containing protein 1